MSDRDLDAIRETVRAFVRERDWERFHSPKNLAMALSVEAAELVEIFQWLTEAESEALTEAQHAAARDEIADVFVYLLRIADRLDVDLLAAVEDKMRRNAEKYPAERVRGRADKYTAYEDD
jgi:NTP pyrophosphatase (non-canonical NTP hydrolase)